MRYLRIVHVLVLTLLVGQGCGSKSEQGALSVTEQQRLSVEPKVAQFLLEAQQAYQRGAYGLALAYTDSVERFAPNLADLHYLRGVVYTQLNQLPVAQAAYETVLEIDPVYRGARFNMGLNAFRRGKLRDAIDYFQEERALEATSDLLLELGRAYAQLGEPDSARMAYQDAIRLDSTNATAYMWLGQLHEELGDFDQALAFSRQGLRLKPDNLDYKYVIGSLLFRSGQVEEAAGYLEPVAEKRLWHHGAQYNLGQVLMRLGREEEAQGYFAQADSAQQLQQQINEAQTAINRDPESLDNWVNLSLLLRKSEQYDLAVEALKVAVSMEPTNLFLQSNLALLLMESGHSDAAIRRFQAILGLDSTLADVWFQLGVAYANAGHREEAQAAWNKTLRYKPGHLLVRTYLRQLADL